MIKVTVKADIFPKFPSEVRKDCMKHSLLRRINACVCLDQYEGIEELLCKGLFFILLSVKLGQLGNSR
ncbi:hypothetical protein CS543_04295 [Porphyromonas gingivalis]|nr:hypothetical protein CS543_04295 [Porphyromonas gingivalis]